MNLILMVLAITGIVGIYKKKPFFLRFLTAAVVWNLLWVMCWFVILHTIADDYTMTEAAATFVSIVCITPLVFLALYLFYTLESLCFILQRERREEEGEEEEEECIKPYESV